MVKVYLRGPMDEFKLPLNSEATESLVFRKKVPGVSAESVAHEVADDLAMDLLTRRVANFHTVDPEEETRLFGLVKDNKKLLKGRRRDVINTSLPLSPPAVEKDTDTPINLSDPLVKEAVNDPRKTK